MEAGLALTFYRWPKTVISRFVARRTFKSAIFWAFIFGAYTASKTLTYAKAYPSVQARAKLAHSFGSNVGLNALLGTPHRLMTTAGFANWNVLGVLTIVGSIWAFLLATKYFRGEEEAGRAELLLCGQTTARSAAVNTLAGLASSLIVLFILTAALFSLIGQSHSINFTPSNAIYFALASVSAAAIFLAVGALSSQLMPTRSKASAVAAAIFGLFFLIRAAADVSTLHWLLNLTPLGWVEKLQPLVGSQPIWLVPIGGLILVLVSLTVLIAGRRDLGDSLFNERIDVQAKTKLLSSPILAAFRLSRANFVAWLLGLSAVGFFYGLLTKTAVTALAQAGAAQKAFGRLAHVANLPLSKLFLGIVFFILMAITMSLAASLVAKVRDDEAEGYADNFLVRPVSRTNWFIGRLALATVYIAIACLVASLFVWAGQASQHSGVPLPSIIIAGLNMIAPVIFTLGVGLLAFGLRPRLTSLLAYSVLGWSFLLQLVSSGVTLNHWLLDTSVLHQISFAPAVNPNWTVDLVMIGLGLGLSLAGLVGFNSRDLAAA